MRSVLSIILTITCSIVLGQTKSSTIDLQALANNRGIDVIGRNWTLDNESKKAIKLDEEESEGIAWIKDMQFSTGTIEFDVKGRDVQGRSFVGVAFHKQDQSHYDVIYLRPFNFRAEDPVRRSHSIQYISSPDYGWQRLREQFPNKYEQSIESPPEPNGWIHVRVEVTETTISSFVEGNKKPSLVVEKLNDWKTGSIGLWVGSQSDGSFANLKVMAK